MLDAETVIASAQQGVSLAGWQVWRERRGYFIYQAVVGVVFLAFGVFGAFYLQTHPNTVYVLGTYGNLPTGQLDAGAFMAWRIADFGVLGLLAILGIVYFTQRTVQAAAGGGQMLVLTPEGLVFRRKNKTQSFPFAAVRSLTTLRSYGTMQVKLIETNGTKTTLKLDGRFGRPKTIARAIIAAYRRVHPDAQRGGRVIDKLRRRGG